MPTYDTNRCLDLYKGLERSYNDYPTSNGIVSDHLSAMARYGAEIFETATEGASHPLLKG